MDGQTANHRDTSQRKWRCLHKDRSIAQKTARWHALRADNRIRRSFTTIRKKTMEQLSRRSAVSADVFFAALLPANHAMQRSVARREQRSRRELGLPHTHTHQGALLASATDRREAAAVAAAGRSPFVQRGEKSRETDGDRMQLFLLPTRPRRRPMRLGLDIEPARLGSFELELAR
jgi:hypothetical protein